MHSNLTIRTLSITIVITNYLPSIINTLSFLLALFSEWRLVSVRQTIAILYLSVTIIYL